VHAASLTAGTRKPVSTSGRLIASRRTRRARRRNLARGQLETWRRCCPAYRSFDPELHPVYWGTGNPGSWNAFDRKGDNLYTCSVLALDPKTGDQVALSVLAEQSIRLGHRRSACRERPTGP
jgi:hypothetical protein